MIDTGLPIREAYDTALDGNITVNSNNIPVFDRIPDDQDYPYIVLFGQEETGGDVETRTKDNKNASEVLFEIHVKTGFKGGNVQGGKKLADQISAEILLIVLASTPLTFAGLENVTSVLDSTSYDQEQTETHRVITKEIVIRHLISQS